MAHEFEPDGMSQLSGDELRIVQASCAELTNQYGDYVYRTGRLQAMTSLLELARMGRLPCDWRDRLTAADYSMLVTTANPGYRLFSDIETLVVTEMQSLPAADWEPGADVGWRRALDSWFDASRKRIAESLTILENASQHSFFCTKEARAAFAIRRSQLTVSEPDMIAASYRAGLCAGGVLNDWRGWLWVRITGWPDGPARAQMLTGLQLPHFLADYQALPDYWCDATRV
jgi:hypothetical protein